MEQSTEERSVQNMTTQRAIQVDEVGPNKWYLIYGGDEWWAEANDASSWFELRNSKEVYFFSFSYDHLAEVGGWCRDTIEHACECVAHLASIGITGRNSSGETVSVPQTREMLNDLRNACIAKSEAYRNWLAQFVKAAKAEQMKSSTAQYEKTEKKRRAEKAELLMAKQAPSDAQPSLPFDKAAAKKATGGK